MADTKRTGWISAVVVIIIAASYYWYTTTPAYSKYKSYYAYYNAINGLQPSSPVMIKGVRIGKIKSIDITGPQVKVTLFVNKDIAVPVDTRAMLTSGGLLSDMSVVLMTGSSKQILADHARLQSAVDTSVMPVSVRVTPYIETAKYLLLSVDSTLRGIDFLTSSGMFTTFITPLMNAEKSLHSLAGTSASLDHKMDGIKNSISSFNKSAEDLAHKSKEWNKTINNADKKTASLAKDSLQKSLQQLASLTKRLSKLTKTATDSTKAVGKLINDKAAYQHTNEALSGVNQSMTELQKSPPGFRLIGKNKKKK